MTTTKKILLTVAILLNLSAGAYPAFRGGQWLQRRADEHEAIANDKAHYAPRTADFIWGSVEEAHLSMLNLSELVAPDSDRPVHKPKLGVGK